MMCEVPNCPRQATTEVTVRTATGATAIRALCDVHLKELQAQDAMLPPAKRSIMGTDILKSRHD